MATNEKGVTNDKSPVKKVTILGPGNMSVPLKKPSSAVGGETVSEQEEATMSERLSVVSVREKGAVKRPSAGQLSTLLSQAVANSNDKLLEDVLRFRDSKVVMATIRGIPLRDVLPFLRKVQSRFKSFCEGILHFSIDVKCVFMFPQLMELLQTSPARGLELSIWLKTVLGVHAMYLTSVSVCTKIHTLIHVRIRANTHTQIPHVLDSFSGLYQLLDSRVNTFPKLCRLQGKLDLLVAQSSGTERDAGRSSINTPLVTVTLGGESCDL